MRKSQRCADQDELAAVDIKLMGLSLILTSTMKAGWTAVQVRYVLQSWGRAGRSSMLHVKRVDALNESDTKRLPSSMHLEGPYKDCACMHSSSCQQFGDPE